MSKIYNFTATYTYSCIAEDDDDAWENFCMSIPYKASHYDDIDWTTEEIEEDEQMAEILGTFKNCP